MRRVHCYTLDFGCRSTLISSCHKALEAVSQPARGRNLSPFAPRKQRFFRGAKDDYGVMKPLLVECGGATRPCSCHLPTGRSGLKAKRNFRVPASAPNCTVADRLSPVPPTAMILPRPYWGWMTTIPCRKSSTAYWGFSCSDAAISAAVVNRPPREGLSGRSFESTRDFFDFRRFYKVSPDTGIGCFF